MGRYEYLFNITAKFVRIVDARGMSIQPISWQEIDAWARRCNANLKPFEYQIISEISETYVSSLSKYNSEDCFCAPPYDDIQQRMALASKSAMNM